MRRYSGILVCGLVLIPLCLLTSCSTVLPRQPAPGEGLAAIARTAPFVTKTERPHPVALPDDVVAILNQKQEAGQTDHLGFLVEYGLRVHWHYLQHTRLARELPVENDMMLAELIRIAGIPKYGTAHEAGWLNSQFNGKFNRSGYSSYQIYLWVKENTAMILADDKKFPNWKHLAKIMDSIDNSGRNGVGGGGVCHYGCI